jgi:hypothetical protein
MMVVIKCWLCEIMRDVGFDSHDIFSEEIMRDVGFSSHFDRLCAFTVNLHDSSFSLRAKLFFPSSYNSLHFSVSIANSLLHLLRVFFDIAT